MPREIATHTLNKGMVTDVNINNRNKESYDYAENLRHTDNDNDVLGALTNFKGFEDYGEIDNTLTIVAHCVIRNYVYLLCSSLPSAGGSDSIYRLSIDPINKDLGTPVLLYGGGSLGLSYLKNTDVIGVYENQDVIKLYWTTTGEILKVANVATYLTSDGLVKSGSNTWVDSSRFDMLTGYAISNLEYVKLISGSLTSGRVQYYYSLYKKYLQESTVNGPTNMINLYESNENLNTVDIKGDYETTNTHKGVELSLTLDTDDVAYFDYIRLYRVHYHEYEALPTVTIVSDTPILDDTDYSLKDYGEVGLGALTIEEFSILKNLYSAKTITNKDQRVILGNVTEEVFDTDFDARAYRFNPSSNAEVFADYGTYTTPEYTVTSSNWSTIADDAELICPTNDIDNDIPILGSDDTSVAVVGIMTDSTATFTVNDLIGRVLYNITDGTSGVITANTATTVTAPGSGTWDSGDEYAIVWEYIYQQDGSTLGGEGPEVEYTFSTSAFILDSASTYSNAQTYNSSTGDNSQVNQVFTNTGYQRGEVYRVGVVFYDSIGRKSKTKWIGDIRFPMGGSGTPNFDRVAYDLGTNVGAYPMGLSVTLKNGLPTGAVSWEVVRSKRTKDDRSIITSGYISLTNDYWDTATAASGLTFKTPYPLYDTTGVTAGSSGTAHTAINGDLVNFISPEEIFQGFTDIIEGDYIDIVGEIIDSTNDTEDGTTYPSTSALWNSIKYYTTQYHNTLYEIERYTIDTSRFFKAYQVSTGPAGAPVYNFDNARDGNYKLISYTDTLFTYGSASFAWGGYHGACTVLEPDSTLDYTTFSSSHANHDLPYVLIKRNNTGRYGGGSYLARESSTYISCGNKVTPSNPAASSQDYFYGGDTYINYFDYKHTLYPKNYTNTADGTFNVLFPVETTINLSLRSDTHNSKAYVIENSYLIQETLGEQIDGITTSNTYNQDEDLYLYNSIYSQEQNFDYRYALNNEEFITEFDARVVASDKKINNEIIDNWLKFPVNNFLDVDSSLGQIEVLHNFNNEIYFWQENAFGVIPVNERSLISDTNPGALSLGTGSIMSRYAYISKIYGTTNLLSVLDTGYGLYWVDSNRNTLLYYSGDGLQDLSKVKGIKKLTKELLNENVTIDAFTCISTFNSDYGEVLFKLTDNKSILYNETLGIVSCVFTSNTYYCFNAQNIVCTFNGTHLYGHDKTDNYNEFLTGTALTHQDSILRITNADSLPYTKTYDNIAFFTYSKDVDGIINNDYFHSIRFWNDYQYTGYDTTNLPDTTDLTLGINLEKKERGYSLSIPRNIVDANGTTNIDIFDSANHNASRTFKERMRDKYLTIEFNYNNSDYLFVIPEIQITYRYSKPTI